MTTLIKDKLFLVFLALLGVTAIAWFTSQAGALPARSRGAALLGLAFVKVRLIILHYMEVKRARPAVRVAFELWVVVTAAMTIALYLR